MIEYLSRIAKNIKSIVDNEDITTKLYTIGDEENDKDNTSKEGKVLYKLHKYYERSSKLAQRKKDTYYQEHGKLDCEVCYFDFTKTYGSLGKGFIECHHRVPLSKLDGQTKITSRDLALVCSNCHRMLHRMEDPSDINGLKRIIKKNNH